MQINEKSIVKFLVKNLGKFPFDFEWNKLKGSKTVSVTEHSAGIVNVDAVRETLIEYQPTQIGYLMETIIKLKVNYGPVYLLSFTGRCVEPSLNFAFDNHDFGSCFLHKTGMPMETRVLNITNRDNTDISFECLTKWNSWLEVDFTNKVLSPLETTGVNIRFKPPGVKRYSQKVEFLINGLSKKSVSIVGKGTQVKLECNELTQVKADKGYKPKLGRAIKCLRLGTILPNDHVVSYFRVTNNSNAKINGNVCLGGPNEAVLMDPSLFSIRSINNSTRHQSSLSGTDISQIGVVSLDKNGGFQDFIISFKPIARINPFKEYINFEMQGQTISLFEMSGACASIQLTLDSQSIPFGAVELGSSNSKKLLMTNTGDIGSRFEWKIDDFGPDFSIKPERGFIAASQEVVFTVIFKPSEINPDIRYERLSCMVDASNHHLSITKLPITLTGVCIEPKQSRDMITFSCQVRQTDTRTISIPNKTSQAYRIQVAIEGRQWVGDEILVIEPNSTKQYEIKYQPLTMTGDKKHVGSIFFPLPDGSGLLYSLVGTADSPKYINTITEDIPCKTNYTKLLPVKNWLAKTQRFKVHVDLQKPDKPDDSIKLSYTNYVDVGPLETVDFKLNFFAYKEQTSITYKISFKNEKTHEFVGYNVTFRSVPRTNTILKTFHLTCPVRRTIQQIIPVNNPKDYPLTFTVPQDRGADRKSSDDLSDLSVPPNFVVAAKEESYPLTIEYQPIKVGEKNVTFALSNQSDLGTFLYEFRLTALPAPKEPVQSFKTALGQTQTNSLKFNHIAKVKADYQCKIDNLDWSCDKIVTAGASSGGTGNEIGLDVTYEPTQVGSATATLTISSQSGGEYVFPLRGVCSFPKPQGPHIIKHKSQVSINFKNVFSVPTQFSFEVDNASFSCKQSETIRPKKTYNIVIGFEYEDVKDELLPITGRLVVKAPVVQGEQQLEWVYYIKGVHH